MVTATTTWTDEEIQHDVIDEPALDGRVQPNEIGVAVKGGVVTLTGWVDACTRKWAAERGDQVVLQGTVRWWAEREEAERGAWPAQGVTSVDDRITISP